MFNKIKLNLVACWVYNEQNLSFLWVTLFFVFFSKTYDPILALKMLIFLYSQACLPQ